MQGQADKPIQEDFALKTFSLSVSHLTPLSQPNVESDWDWCMSYVVSSYSGIPSGGTTTFKILSINLYFRILSLTVVDVSDGEAFTSTSQAFKLLSIIMS